MKKLLISLFSISLLLMVGCNPVTQALPPIGSVAVMFPLDAENNPRWGVERGTMINYLGSQNYFVSYGGAKEGNGAEQAEQIKEVIERFEPKYIILATVDAYSTQINDAIAEFAASGGKVICYDRLQQNSPHISALISNSYTAIGELQFAALNKLGVGSRIEMIAGPRFDNNAKTLYLGAYNSIKDQLESGNWTCPSNRTEYEDVAMADWSKNEAFKRMETILKEHYTDRSFPNAVLAGNDIQAAGVLDALNAHNIEGLKIPIITGMDNTDDAWQRISKGEQTMTVFKNPVALIQQTSDVLGTILKNEPIITPKSVYNGSVNVPLFEVGELKAVYKEDIDKLQ